MNTKDAMRFMLEMNQQVMKGYLGDFTDEELLVRPVPEANHLAWQMGHLIAAEATFFLPQVAGAKPPTLPAGFVEAHSKENASADNSPQFLSKSEYLDLYDKTRAATLAALDQIDEAEFDKPTGMDFAPTVGKLFMMMGNHDMMHAGQFVVARRKLGKPVLF